MLIWVIGLNQDLLECIMRGERFYNDKGEEHGPWSLILEDGYYEGHYLNGIRYGFWELSNTVTLTRIYYVR